MVTFSHTDAGTPESEWVGAGLPAAPELPLDATELAARHFVVLAAHPDDESLGAAGLLATLSALGATVEILLCSAGEGSHPASPTFSPEQLAAVRTAEFSQAMDALGLQGRWSLLGFPDRGIAAHAASIADAVRRAVARYPGRPEDVVLVAPYRADGHADHDCLGTVAAGIAASGGHGMLEYPIWYWHWAGPGHPAWRDWLRFQPEPEALVAKARALDAHASQVLPLSAAPGDEVLLGEGFQEHFSRTYEVFAWTPPRVEGGRHRSRDAQRIFDRVHGRDEDPWNYATSWYERRKRALTLAVLPAEAYAAGLEIGCSIGTLTEELAPRCASLIAIDASGIAVRRAAVRLARYPHVAIRQLVVPEDWPRGTFDLVVVSEVGYYLAPDELAVLWDRVEESLQPGATLVLCHWRHPVEGWELDGEAVHSLARERLGWRSTGLYREKDFILEVLVRDLVAEGSGAGPA